MERHLLASELSTCAITKQQLPMRLPQYHAECRSPSFEFYLECNRVYAATFAKIEASSENPYRKLSARGRRGARTTAFFSSRPEQRGYSGNSLNFGVEISPARLPASESSLIMIPGEIIYLVHLHVARGLKEGGRGPGEGERWKERSASLREAREVMNPSCARP